MARLNVTGADEILSAASRWLSRCVVGEQAMFTNTPLWTTSNLTALHRAFFGNLIEDSSRTFYEKLHEQLQHQTNEVKQLAAEIVWVMLLFPSRIDGRKKREDIRDIWRLSGTDLSDMQADLGRVLDSGIGHAGVAFNTLRWMEFGYFLQMMTTLRSLSKERQTQLLSNPWSFARWIDDETTSKNRALRHILLFLMFPDYFERIANSRHKRTIVSHFGSLIGESRSSSELRKIPRSEIDQKILSIREQLASQYPGVELDFYRPPLSQTFTLLEKPHTGAALVKSGRAPVQAGTNGEVERRVKVARKTPEAVEVSTPAAGFRATELSLADLVSDVANGDIGLPDIQRPFVWTSLKVRDLFDSMYRGYPVGYLLFWQTNEDSRGSRVIGINEKAFSAPKRLIVDGQQRLTSLFAVMKGIEVLDDEYQPKSIAIAFRPRDGRFDVTDAAIVNDPEYIPNVSRLMTDQRGAYDTITEFINGLAQQKQLTDREKQIIGKNLNRLFGLNAYRFSVLEISSSLEEEAVADIFVRINNEGVKLKQADFILTLLSVIWDEGRTQLEAFSRDARRPPQRRGAPSAFNHLFTPSPDQLLRVSVALAFGRARMKSVYHLLRGKDPDTGALVLERRSEQLSLLQQGQARALNIDHWQRFLACITAAGFRLPEQVTSQNALLIAYALYVQGLTRAFVEPALLDALIARWFWMAVLTARFSSNAETIMEEDLKAIEVATDSAKFIAVLERAIETGLTNDYWNLVLPRELETSSSRSAAWVCFVAAQLRLDAAVLFSDKKIWNILDPLTRGPRRAFEAHHLFPKAWLKSLGITSHKEINQIANLAFLEWPANAKAGSRGPAQYVPDLKRHLPESKWEQMSRLHALPPNWWELDYGTFLAARRQLIADIIKRGFESLSISAGANTQDDRSGSKKEIDVWNAIADLERTLRMTIRRQLNAKWGEDPIRESRKC